MRKNKTKHLIACEQYPFEKSIGVAQFFPCTTNKSSLAPFHFGFFFFRSCPAENGGWVADGIDRISHWYIGEMHTKTWPFYLSLSLAHCLSTLHSPVIFPQQRFVVAYPARLAPEATWLLHRRRHHPYIASESDEILTESRTRSPRITASYNPFCPRVCK